MQLGILIVLSLQMKFLTWKQYTQHWVTAKMESGLLGTLPFLGRSASFVPKNNSLKDPFRSKGPGLQSNNCSSVFIRTRHLFRTVTKSKLFVEQAVMVGALALQRQGCMLTGFDTGHWR